MITSEVNEFIKKVELGAYSKEDALERFAELSRYLTRGELAQVLARLKKL